MNSEKASKIVSLLADDVLIVNWFNKEWFEEAYKITLTEEEYKFIIEKYQDTNWCDDGNRIIEDFMADCGIITEIMENRIEKARDSKLWSK